jgi:hypothetical protein
MTHISVIFDVMMCSSRCESDNINHNYISGAWHTANLASEFACACRNHY